MAADPFARIILQGDRALAAKWLPEARRLQYLLDLQDSSYPLEQRTITKHYAESGAMVTVQRVYGKDVITIHAEGKRAAIYFLKADEEFSVDDLMDAIAEAGYGFAYLTEVFVRYLKTRSDSDLTAQAPLIRFSAFPDYSTTNIYVHATGPLTVPGGYQDYSSWEFRTPSGIILDSGGIASVTEYLGDWYYLGTPGPWNTLTRTTTTGTATWGTGLIGSSSLAARGREVSPTDYVGVLSKFSITITDDLIGCAPALPPVGNPWGDPWHRESYVALHGYTKLYSSFADPITIDEFSLSYSFVGIYYQNAPELYWGYDYWWEYPPYTEEHYNLVSSSGYTFNTPTPHYYSGDPYYHGGHKAWIYYLSGRPIDQIEIAGATPDRPLSKSPADPNVSIFYALKHSLGSWATKSYVGTTDLGVDGHQFLNLYFGKAI